MDNTLKLLIAAAEDLTGLWQATLELSHEKSAEDAARRALAEMIGEGLIELFVGDDLVEVRELEPAEVFEALRPGPQWLAPQPGSKGPFVYFGATDAGVALLTELHWGQGG